MSIVSLLLLYRHFYIVLIVYILVIVIICLLFICVAEDNSLGYFIELFIELAEPRGASGGQSPRNIFT